MMVVRCPWGWNDGAVEMAEICAMRFGVGVQNRTEVSGFTFRSLTTSVRSPKIKRGDVLSGSGLTVESNDRALSLRLTTAMKSKFRLAQNPLTRISRWH